MRYPPGRRRKLGALRLVREDSFDAPANYPATIQCATPREVFQFMEPYALREEVEVFWILALNTRRHIIWNRPLTVTRGVLDKTLIQPREVFRLAIHANAFAVIAVHNHPSGDPTPSVDDRMTTEGLVAAGRVLEIPLFDHLILGAGRYVSFAESGLL